MRFAFQMLQAYRMPKHRLTVVPAKTTTQARTGVRSSIAGSSTAASYCMIGNGGSVAEECLGCYCAWQRVHFPKCNRGRKQAPCATACSQRASCSSQITLEY